MKKLFNIFLLSIAIIALSSISAFAESTAAALTSAQIIEAIQNGDAAGYNAPYSKDDFPAEYIDPLNGTLTIKEDILHLPGRNGFDLNLSATYNSDSTGTTFFTESSAYDADFSKKAYYYSYDNNGEKKYILIAPYYPEEFENYNYNSFYVSSVSAYPQTDDFDTDFYWLHSFSTEANNILLTREPDMAPVTIAWEKSTILASDCPNMERLNFSDIWKWDIPFITEEIHPVVYDSNDTYYYRKQTTAFTDLYGEYCTVTLKHRSKKISGAISNPSITIEDGTGDYTGHYTGEDIVDSERGITYRCSITDSLGRTMYFTQSGFLCAVEDRFGNIIKYTFEDIPHEYGRLNKIVDSLGRIITFNYTDNDVKIYISASSTAPAELYAEFKNTRTNSAEDTTDVFAFDDECISKLIHYENSETDYVKSFKYSKYNLAFYTSQKYAFHMPIECEIVKEVTNPNGAKSIFDYSRTRNTQNTIQKEHYSVSERYDKDGSDKFNQFTYTYETGNDSVTTRSLDNQTNTYEGSNGKIISMVVKSDGEIRTEEYLGNNRERTQTKTSYNSHSEKSSERKFKTPHSLHRPTGVSYDDYEKTITYFGNSSFVESEIYNQNEDVFIKTTYTLSEEGDDFYQNRTVDTMTVWESTDEGDTYTEKYTVEYTYNPDGTLASETVDPDGINRVTTYAYTYGTDGSITTTVTTGNLKDADGNSIANITTVSKVNYLGQPVYTCDGNGNETTYEYDGIGRLVKVTNPDDTTITYEYDTQNRTTIVTDENGIMQKALYDGFGNPLVIYKNTSTTTTPRWIAIAEYEYDALCRPVIVAEYTGYNTRNLPTKWIEMHYSYGAFDNVSEVVTYDETGTELTKETYSYNYADRLCTNSLPGSHEYANGGSSRKFTSVTVESTPKDGITPPTVKQFIDRQGRLVKQIRTDGDNEYITTYTYDAIGNVLECKDESAYADYDVDYSQKYEYNYISKPVKVYNAEGNYIENEYDILGNLLTQTDYMGSSVNYTYDSIGRLLTESAPVDTNRSSLVKYYYDANSNTICTTKMTASGNVSYTNTYDNRNRPISSFNGSTYTVNEYDDGGRCIKTASGLPSVMDISSLDSTHSTYNVAEFVYDNYGNIVTEKTFNGETAYTYDLAGNILSTTDPRGVTITNEYDSRGNVVKSNAQGANNSYSYNAFNLMTSASRNSYTIEYTYDNLGRNTSETTGSRVLSRTYNTAGQVKAMTLKQGDTVLQFAEYEYNVLGNMTSASDGIDTVIYEYNENALPVREEKAGFVTEYEYTEGNLIRSVTHKNRRVNDPTYEEGYNDLRDVSYFFFGYTRDGNVNNAYEVRNGKAKYTYYTYDSANRLTRAELTDGSDNLLRLWQYTYNNRGDRTNQSVTDETGVTTQTSYFYTNHRLTRETTNGSTTNYTYDANGNVTSVISDSSSVYYSYNTRNEVASVTTASGTQGYSYDALSRRITAGLTLYTWAGDNIIREETSDKSTDYFYGVNRVSRTVKGDAYTYDAVIDAYYDEALDEYIEVTTPVNGYHEFYAYDGRGNVVHTMMRDMLDLYIKPFYAATAPFPEADLNADGIIDLMDLNAASMKYPIVQDYYYSPFGELWQGERATDTNPFRYAGEYHDKETGNIYLRARYYDPSIGRFISEDPIKDGMNWYVYCGNNPIAFVDSLGLTPTPVEAAYIAAHIYDFDKTSRYSDRQVKYEDGSLVGWRLIDSIKGQEGMKMGIYIREGDDWQNPSEYVVAFKGTTFLNIEDWENNFEQLFSSNSTDMWDAINNGIVFVNSHSGYEITFVGHSKGGAEAASTAVATNQNAILFNPATSNLAAYGLSVSNYTADMTAYIVQGDILNTIEGWFSTPIDKKVPLKQQYGDKWYTGWKTSIVDRILNHLMGAVKSALKEEGYQ